jgi:Ca2+-binding RTX toxin-like protein
MVGDGITNANALNLTGTAEANSIVTVFDSTMQLGTATANASGAWSFATAHLTDGNHSFVAFETDGAGETSAPSAALAVVVDTQAPTPVFSNLVQNSNGTVTLKGTSEAHSAVSIYDGTNTTALGTVTTDANGAWSFTTGKLSNFVHSFTAKAMDAAGNVGSGTGAALYGTNGNNTLSVGPGNDLVTGRNGSDTFVFGTSFGKDVITDFQASGWHHDVLQFSHNTFSNFAAVLAHAAQVGSDVVITADAADTVTLHNVQLSSLQKGDFHIV